MSETTQLENEELAKKQHFEEIERVGQINLFEDAYQQEKLKAEANVAVNEPAQELVVEQAMDSAQDEPTLSDGERIAHNGEREAENGAQNQSDGEHMEQNGATLFEQAMAKLEAEMKSGKNPYVQAVGQFLLEFLKQRPEFSEHVMQEGKTIAKSLDAMHKEAEKRKVGNFAVLTSEEGFAIVLEYYGIQGGAAAPKVDASQMAKQLADKLTTEAQPPAPAPNPEKKTEEHAEKAAVIEQAKKPSKLSFDVDIDELL